MNPFQFLSRIRIPSLFILLALAANASPVISIDLKVLTPDNFDSTVANGNWFIEHFSPYCHHCRAFAPTWEKLVKHFESDPASAVHLAQVNCASHGDLCNKHGVTGYPQMMMYKNGVSVSQFKGPREWSTIISFINEHAPNTHVEPTKEATHTQEKHVPQITLGPNSEGMVKALDESSFKSMINEGPTFVKFYAPWCGHCKKLAPTWTQIALHFRNKLNVAEVNCDVHKNLCKSQDIQGYPSLFFYSGSNDDVHKTEYAGGRKFDQIRQFAESAIAPSVLTLDSVSEYVNLVQKHSVLYLFLNSQEDSHSQNILNQVSRHLLGSPTVLSSRDHELRSKFQLPSEYAKTPVLLSIKDNVPYEYTSVFAFKSGHKDEETLSKDLLTWAMNNRIPSALQLDQESFQKVMNAPHHPLVVIAATVPSEEAHTIEIINESSRLWRQQVGSVSQSGNVIFTWMDLDKWANWLKSMYGIKDVSKTTVVITDHQNLLYYDTKGDGQGIGLDAKEITSTVNDILAGRLKYKNSENFVERTARRINNLLVLVEEKVVENPFRSVVFILIIFLLTILGIKRLLKEDSSINNVRPYKATGHLD
ncbi:thioredoxin-domain-containing [Pyrrhoderma noxium]|uniref:Thioredoxin-domain-containing n=1 Tax=Pyrrhoderma noxium TaxID=2282107 RepID=A0A286ULW6_9AGAM|nr:thioredoxin-domain-containing [Pyrrhoderma noxium]